MSGSSFDMSVGDIAFGACFSSTRKISSHGVGFVFAGGTGRAMRGAGEFAGGEAFPENSFAGNDE